MATPRLGCTGTAVQTRSRRALVRLPAVWLASGAAAAAVVAATVAVTAPWDDGPGPGTTPTGPAGSTGSCGPACEAVLPTWARTGFSEPDPMIAYVRSEHGRIVAILFGRVLHAPPAQEVNNKILWVARTSSAEPLRIEALRAGDGRPVHREVAGGPSPSIIDLPRAGCWHLTLRWGDAPDQRDTMTLPYVDPRKAAPQR